MRTHPPPMPAAVMNVRPPSTDRPTYTGLRRAPSQPRLRPVALRAPLVVKLIGANLLTLCLFAVLWAIASPLPGVGVVGLVAVTVVIGLLCALHLLLVMIALHPVRELEEVASRVWSGDYAARVEASAGA